MATKEKCFADAGNECKALNRKACTDCAFYKPLSDALDAIKDYEGYDLQGKTAYTKEDLVKLYTK